MVERGGVSGEPAVVPTFAELLSQYRDRTGASYDDMSASVNGAIAPGWFEKLHKNKISAFPRKPATVEHLARLLEVPVTTILATYAATLGVRVEQAGSQLSISLPPGSDILEPRDVEAVRAVIRQLVDARRAAGEAGPDLSNVQKLRIAEPDNSPAPADTQTTK